MTDFDMFGLPEPLMRALQKDGFENPTEIQKRSIPHLLRGTDFIGLAETGTGKTAAFLLPVMSHLLAQPERAKPGKPRALILAPTRELALQIMVTVENLGRFTNLRSTPVYGGASMHKQKAKLKSGLDILVATPGRLMDHYRQGNLAFDDTYFFILDEADRMLDMGFINDVKNIAKELPTEHQTLLFSATMNKDIDKLSRSLLDKPERVDISSKIAVSGTIDHKVMHVGLGQKKRAMNYLLDEKNKIRQGQVIIFTKTKRGADKLRRDLAKTSLSADAIHGDRNQRQRMRTLQNFRDGKVTVLVATDVAARGIDVPGIDMVINFDLPLEPEAYVHRVGRTGRNGMEGKAFSICTPDDVALLRDIEKLLKKSIIIDTQQPFHEDLPEGFIPPPVNKGGGRGRGAQGARGRIRAGGGGGNSRNRRRKKPGSGGNTEEGIVKSWGKKGAENGKRSSKKADSKTAHRGSKSGNGASGVKNGEGGKRRRRKPGVRKPS